MLLVAVRDLLFRSKIEAAATRLALPLEWVPRGEGLAVAARRLRPDAILVDLGEASALEEVRGVLAEAPQTRVVGFLGHLRMDLMEEARALGVAEVLTRGQLSARMDEVLSRARGCGM